MDVVPVTAEATSLFRRRKSSTMARSFVVTLDCDGWVSCNSVFAHLANNWPDALVSPCNALTQRLSRSAS